MEKTPSRHVVRFGIFEVDLRTGELRKEGLKVKLQEQPFHVLATLLEHAGEVVTREELRQKLWPSGTFVDFDVGLNTAINRLREALGDAAENPRFVETLARRGYRFIGQVNGSAGSTEVAAPLAGRHRLQPIWIAAPLCFAVMALLVGLNVGRWRDRLVPRRAAPSIQSIAVLPLENLTGDPGQEYFVDGMTDALITNLAQISALRVISRQSVMAYKGSHKSLLVIAKELNVDGIVAGTVVRSGDQVRISAQLIQAATDVHLWAHNYERNLTNIVALQGDVVQAITSEIRIKLTPQEQARLLRTESVDPQTYELYLKGRYFWGKRTEDSIRKSIDYFQQAILREPNYALAYAAMAESYVTRIDLSPEERYSRAKAAARTALQMDEGLAEAHNALAMSLFSYDWDWVGAEKEFQRALALNPNYAMAHQWYGQYQHAMGWQNWAAEVKRAHELDPLSLVTAGGGWAIASGQYDLAIETMRKKLELDPNFSFGYIWLGKVYTRKGMYQDAVAQLQKGVSLSGGGSQSLSTLGYTYGVSGKRDEALKILHQLTLLSKRTYVSPYYIALVYVGLGEKELAFDWLQKAVADRSPQLLFLKQAEEIGEMDSLRSDPRYAELKRRIGLPQ